MNRLSSNFAGNFANLDEFLRALAGVFSVVFALLAAILAAVGGSSNEDAGSSRSDGYVSPGLDDSIDLEFIRGDMLYAINKVCADEVRADVLPVTSDLKLQYMAQSHAEGNAMTGTFAPLDADVAMMQASLSKSQATSHNVMNEFLLDQPNTDLMISPEHAHLGVGVAQGQDRVWVVVVYSRQ